MVDAEVERTTNKPGPADDAIGWVISLLGYW